MIYSYEKVKRNMHKLSCKLCFTHYHGWQLLSEEMFGSNRRGGHWFFSSRDVLQTPKRNVIPTIRSVVSLVSILTINVHNIHCNIIFINIYR